MKIACLVSVVAAPLLCLACSNPPRTSSDVANTASRSSLPSAGASQQASSSARSPASSVSVTSRVTSFGSSSNSATGGATQNTATSQAIAGSTVATSTAATASSHTSAVNHPGPPHNTSCAATVPAQPGGRWAQSILFPAPGTNHYVPDSRVVLNACASSGLPISYSLAAGNNHCVLSGNILDATASPAQCAVIASQNGNAQWASATPVTMPYRLASQFVQGNWGLPDPAKDISLSSTMFRVQIVITSSSPFEIGDAGLDSADEDVCRSADYGSVNGSRSATVSLTIELGGKTGDCTLSMRLDGSASAVPNQIAQPRTYHITA